MARTPVVGGNWKMNTARSEAQDLLRDVRARLDGIAGAEVIVFPPAPWIADAAD
ncbi:MAG: triose-phosphate isomerase, partial [Chloroflexi bacterium]